MTFLKNIWRKFFRNQLVAGSAVMFIGSMVGSFGNYLFHLLMGRMLGPVDYGVLASLISLTYLFGIPVGTLSLVVVKYVSALRGKDKLGVVVYFYHRLNERLIVLGLAGLVLLIIVSPWLASFLHLESSLPVILMVAFSLVGVYLTVNTATLQGFLRFSLMSTLGIIQVVLKLTVAIFLVYSGWKYLGAVWAILISSLLVYLLALFFVKRVLGGIKEKKEKIGGREVVGYAVPVFFSTLAFASLYTTDIVLVRHFLSAQDAGFYAALANLGKIIFFAASPIMVAMFPMVSERHANKKNCLNLLGSSFGLVSLICLGISSVYFLFPQLMVNLLFGVEYLPAASYLFLFALFLSFYSLASLLVNFYLSIRKVKVVALPAVAAVVQAVLISLFHQNLSQVVWISIGVLGLLLIGLLVYFFLDHGQEKKTPSFRYRSGL